jgi:hypothetical protein
VIDLLEKMSLAYTGADAHFYDPTREDMKRVALSQGLLTPAWAFAYAADEVQGERRVFKFCTRDPHGGFAYTSQRLRGGFVFL